MGRIKLIIIGTLISINGIYGNEYSDSINAANNYYTQGQYEKAINAYQYIIASGFEAPGLYYNLGNAYFKSNNNTLAIYYYEKALRIAPKDKEIIHNLEIANALTVDKIDIKTDFFIKRWISELGKLFSVDIWAILSVTLFVASLLLIVIYLFTHRISLKKLCFLLGILLFVLAIISLGYANNQLKWQTGEKEAIIYTPTVVVKSSPDHNGSDRFILHEGTKVFILKDFEDWREIELQDGESKGWIMVSDLLII
ncbi:MAG: tetratricopeptide repeat protein [Bacteroidales bacterium]|nr:tetratricopeptide repeat protein [Bacteroidales bacterium]